MRIMVCTLAMAIAAAEFSSNCYGQSPDRNLPPTFGSVRLNRGFLPDPYSVNIRAGGAIHINLGGTKAWVAKAPDFKLFYTAGSLPLTFSVQSSADTTLLINLPDGTWISDDDSGRGLNPRIRLSRPQSGRYDIWVGTFNKGIRNSTLRITELK